MCGKQRANFDAADDNAAGPPPRAWGAPAHRLDQRVQDRTIPTCVGSTPAPVWGRGAPADHPHVRGEHTSSGVGNAGARGPSPRAWGAPTRPGVHPDPGRTIPTCVGSTATSVPTGRGGSDHPHVRGEHLIDHLPGELSDGPSPRAWGARRTERGRGPQLRTIPTCVGSTRSGKSQLMTWADHPHVRGEHVVQTQHCHATAGPSPRAWGAQKLTCDFSGRYLGVTNHTGSLRLWSQPRPISR